MNGYYIGADIGGTSAKIGIISPGGRVLQKIEASYSGSVMDAVTEGIAQLVSGAPEEAGQLLGIGVSSAGCINSVTGKVAANGGNVPDWSHTDIAGVLGERFGVPVTAANDGSCAVLGECWTGAAAGYTDVVGVTLGTGVGGGIIVGGRLLLGSRGYAGEIGHFPTHVGGDHCVCGLDGCFERYASTAALVRKSSAADPAWDNGRAFFEAVSAGNETAARILDEWIDEIAAGIAGLVHIFDPQLVLIGGGVSRQEDLLIKPLRERVLGMIMPDFADGLEFRAAALGNDAGMIGAVYQLIHSAGEQK